MKLRPRWILPLLLVLGGCQQPFHVMTDANVTTNDPMVQDRGPMFEMTVTETSGASGRKVALVDIDGLLVNMNLTGIYSMGENPVAVFREKLDRIERDGCYCAVVLRINSHGGGVTACDIMRRDLVRFKNRTGLPVVACLMDVATGGAYYLATAADQIIAHPTTVTGGMGVILNLYNLQDAMQQFNILGAVVKSGKHADLGTPIEPRGEEASKILQQVADQFHQRLRNVVRESRGIAEAGTEEWFDGRIFTAEKAHARKLIDTIGYMDDAIDIGRRMGGCPQAEAVMLHRCSDQARTPYAITRNAPQQGNLIPFSIPGLDRSQIPTFLYLWQPEPSMVRRGSR